MEGIFDPLRFILGVKFSFRAPNAACETGATAGNDSNKRMYHVKRCYFAFCFVFLPVAVFSQNAAQSATFPRITPDTKAVEYGEMQNYSWRDLAEIALWA